MISLILRGTPSGISSLKGGKRQTLGAKFLQTSPLQRDSILQNENCNPPRQVAIRVLDQAGGIPFHAADKVWSYMYSTASKAFAGRYSG